ncbi:hypothetical protein AB0L41_05520 [Amycolatopsis mediterranei]|uniref:hypothetical protein n=1 Tax=Amycolatopsis mediterranei TaxID=33910 RepID=UPI00343225ED
MTYGFVRLYRRDWSPGQVRRRVDSLAAAGMVLGHLRTGRITALSGEWETCGEQVGMDRDGVLAAMAGLGEKQFTFQYWMADDEDADVVCTLTRLGDVVVEDYDLDDIMTGGPTPVTVTPELMVLPPEVARLHPELGELVPYDGFLAYDRDGILALAP